MVDAAPSGPLPLEVLILIPPDQYDALVAALPPPGFHPVLATTATLPDHQPDVIVFSLDDPADLPRLHQLAAGGVPVIVVLDAGAALAERALAAGASEYVYRVGNWPALLPFHLRRAVGSAPPGGREEPPDLHKLAHDLRGPMTYLVGYSELLAMRALPSAQVQQMAQEMLREAEKLSDLLDRFVPPRNG